MAQIMCLLSETFGYMQTTDYMHATQAAKDRHCTNGQEERANGWTREGSWPRGVEVQAGQLKVVGELIDWGEGRGIG
jgi:hypothetical protein